MDKKYLFLDIDGTLVDFDGKMPKSSFKALEKAQQNGHELVICTGRQLSQVYPWLLKKVPFDGLIVSGGAMVIRNGETIFHNCFNPNELSQIVDYFEDRQISYYLQTSTELVTKKWCTQKSEKFFMKHGYDPKSLDILFGLSKIDENLVSRTDVEKIVYYDSGKEVREIQKEVGDKYHIVGYSFGNMGKTNGELSINGINKATGIFNYLKHCNANIQDSIAFGDADNDIEMLKAAGISVAMGNATDELKAVSDYVTAPITDDGLYKAFEKFNLI